MEEHTLKDFLENTPPGKTIVISDMSVSPPEEDEIRINLPEIQLHCSSAECGGVRFFSPVDDSNHEYGRIYLSKKSKENDRYLVYICKNCEITAKTYSVSFLFMEKWTSIKYGEIPSFGPPTPSRLLTLIRLEKDLSIFGRRCENQGMGIGAFAYYRRVVENQKNQIFDEIIRVIKTIAPENKALISELELPNSSRNLLETLNQ